MTAAAGWAGLAGTVAGLMWLVFATGYVFTHGSTETPRGAVIASLTALDFTRLLAVPPLLFVVALVAAARAVRPDRALAIGTALAIAGSLMISVGAFLQTSIVDPNADFGHPAVQSGWLLYIFGLFPVLSIGALVSAIASRRLDRTTRLAAAGIGGAALLPWFGGFVSATSTGTVGWDLLHSLLSGSLGLSWIAFGYALWERRADPRRP